MSAYEDAYARHQQARWMRPDAHRWVRPDAARFLLPGADILRAYPALERKYRPDQPRVPAGNGRESGRWTDGSFGGGGGGAISRPMRAIDFSDLPNFSELFALFQITPQEFDTTDNVQLAGDPPGIGHNGGPPIEPPEIPQARPLTSAGRMDIVWNVVEWIGKVGRYSPLASVFFAAEDQVAWFSNYSAMIKTYHDPPQTLEQLQRNALNPSERGYQDHHIEEQGLLSNLGFVRADIDNPNNIVRIPTLKHYDITAWYATPNSEFGGVSPREHLRSQSADVRRQMGLRALVRFGVLKP